MVIPIFFPVVIAVIILDNISCYTSQRSVFLAKNYEYLLFLQSSDSASATTLCVGYDFSDFDGIENK